MRTCENEETEGRATAYCLAKSFRCGQLFSFISSYTSPKVLDDNIIYCKEYYSTGRHKNGGSPGLCDGEMYKCGHIFLFDYGVVIFWGLTEKRELAFIEELGLFLETPTLIQCETFQYAHTASKDGKEDVDHLVLLPTSSAPGIVDDIIYLPRGDSFATNVLALSHALAQSVKLGVYEDWVSQCIERTKGLPSQLSLLGRLKVPRMEITSEIGKLFVLRMDVNVMSNVLVTPKFFWNRPELEPMYLSTRSYLEIDQRVDALNQKYLVISDTLEMMRNHLNATKYTKLVRIVIVLIIVAIMIEALTFYVEIASFSGASE